MYTATTCIYTYRPTLSLHDALPISEEEAGRDIHPLERIVDALEMRREEIARAGAELIDEKGATGAQDAVRRRGDRRADSRGERRKRQAREDIVGLLETVRRDDLFDVGGRSVDGDEAAVADVLPQIVDEILVGVDRDQRCIAGHPFEHRAA